MPDSTPTWPGQSSEVEARAVEAGKDALMATHKRGNEENPHPQLNGRDEFSEGAITSNSATAIKGATGVLRATAPIIAQAGYRAGIEEARTKLETLASDFAAMSEEYEAEGNDGAASRWAFESLGVRAALAALTERGGADGRVEARLGVCLCRVGPGNPEPCANCREEEGGLSSAAGHDEQGGKHDG